ncbi:plasmid-partitioning protein SopA [Klebsiella quasipneumoniae]|nr:plasmid-partitioning protein SopA [Klebsiella quasipneumoniae]
MGLMDILNQCITAGHEMTKAIAIAQFNDDSPEARKITRRWRIGEAADLVGVSSQAIRDAEKAGRLPHPDMETRGRVEQRVGYTIEQINHMRDVFGTRLRRAEDAFPPVIGVAAHKGGVYKTSVSVHLAQDLALERTPVFFSLKAMTHRERLLCITDGCPIFIFMLRTLSCPFILGEKDDASYAIKPTCWPGLDIIPSCLALHRIETELMGKFDEGKLPADPHLMLRLAIETVAHDYDVIVIDSAPNLGIGTINVVCAADVLIVPTPAELFDYTSALQFFDMLRDLLKNVDLKGFEPDVRILLTKYSNNNGSQSPWMEEQIRDAWGSMVLKNVVRETDEVGKGQIRMRTVFEQAIDQRSSTGAWRNALSIWEPVCDEIFDRLIKPRWEIR